MCIIVLMQSLQAMSLMVTLKQQKLINNFKGYAQMNLKLISDGRVGIYGYYVRVQGLDTSHILSTICIQYERRQYQCIAGRVVVRKAYLLAC